MARGKPKTPGSTELPKRGRPRTSGSGGKRRRITVDERSVAVAAGMAQVPAAAAATAAAATVAHGGRGCPSPAVEEGAEKKKRLAKQSGAATTTTSAASSTSAGDTEAGTGPAAASASPNSSSRSYQPGAAQPMPPTTQDLDWLSLQEAPDAVIYMAREGGAPGSVDCVLLRLRPRQCAALDGFCRLRVCRGVLHIGSATLRPSPCWHPLHVPPVGSVPFLQAAGVGVDASGGGGGVASHSSVAGSDGAGDDVAAVDAAAAALWTAAGGDVSDRSRGGGVVVALQPLLLPVSTSNAAAMRARCQLRRVHHPSSLAEAQAEAEEEREGGGELGLKLCRLVQPPRQPACARPCVLCPAWEAALESVARMAALQEAAGTASSSAAHGHGAGGGGGGGSPSCVVMAVGKSNTGKSTLLRALVNTLLTRRPPSARAGLSGGGGGMVAYLDLDPGQCELSPPGLLSLSLIVDRARYGEGGGGGGRDVALTDGQVPDGPPPPRPPPSASARRHTGGRAMPSSTVSLAAGGYLGLAE
jgi:hypothetical protein